MRRATAVVLGTLTGTTLLVVAKLGTAAPAGPDDPAADGGVTVAVPGGTATGRPSVAPGSTAPKASPTGGKPTTGKPTHATAPGTTPTPAAAGLKDGTYTAKAPVDHGDQGTLSMTVTISGHRITNVAASESGGESSCYHQACPKLTAEALAAQSANVATVSRATHTSQAYRAALGAVLNAAGA